MYAHSFPVEEKKKKKRPNQNAFLAFIHSCMRSMCCDAWSFSVYVFEILNDDDDDYRL